MEKTTILNAIETLEKYFNDPENFKTKVDKLEGVLISNTMDLITTDFVQKYIRPEVEKDTSKNILVNVVAKA